MGGVKLTNSKRNPCPPFATGSTAAAFDDGSKTGLATISLFRKLLQKRKSLSEPSGSAICVGNETDGPEGS
jgi:hypothetical protein